MESIVKKLFLSGCLVLGLATSLTALSSTHAANETTQGNTAFKLTVDKVLTLSDVSAVDITAKTGEIATGNLTAKVQSNSKFSISLKAATPALTSGSYSIPAASNLNSTTTDGWGIKKQGATDYTALTTSDVVFYTSTGPALTTAADISLPVGVRTTKTTAAGTYTTTVTVTAATVN